MTIAKENKAIICLNALLRELAYEQKEWRDKITTELDESIFIRFGIELRKIINSKDTATAKNIAAGICLKCKKEVQDKKDNEKASLL